MIYFLIFSLSLLLSLTITPYLIKIAYKYNIVDKPNDRKIHQNPIPYLGGISIYLSFVVVSSILHFSDYFTDKPYYFFVTLIIGGTTIVFLGILDDKFDLSAKKKIAYQLFVAIFVVYMGIKIEYIFIPFVGEMVHLGWLSIPITIFWIIGITNAINLIDGLDGLAAGVSSIAIFSFFVIALMSNQQNIAFLSIILLGSILGFLYFNFHPAKIFMGDTGSLFLGFSLSLLTLQELKQVTFFTLIVPIMLLAIPILDTSYALLRRKINHQPIFKADKHHLHHQLMSNGLSHKKTVIVIYLISLTFAIFGILMPYFNFWISCFVAFILLSFFQIIAKHIGLLHPESSFLNKRFFKNHK